MKASTTFWDALQNLGDLGKNPEVRDALVEEWIGKSLWFHDAVDGIATGATSTMKSVQKTVDENKAPGNLINGMQPGYVTSVRFLHPDPLISLRSATGDVDLATPTAGMTALRCWIAFFFSLCGLLMASIIGTITELWVGGLVLGYTVFLTLLAVHLTRRWQDGTMRRVDFADRLLWIAHDIDDVITAYVKRKRERGQNVVSHPSKPAAISGFVT